MHKKIQKAFGEIHATEQMKQSVSDYLAHKNLKTAKASIRTSLYPLLSVCTLLLLCFGISGWYFLGTPVSYVSVDVNPSIELTLNRMNYVTKAESKNKEGQSILKHLNLKGKNYLEAIELLVECDTMQPYLTKDADLTFTVASSKAEELLSDLQNSTVTAKYHGMCRQADMEMVISAHKCGMSLGKYQIYYLLSQYDPTVTTEECQHMSMCQLHDTLLHYENRDNPDTITEQNTDCEHEHGGNHHHKSENHK